MRGIGQDVLPLAGRSEPETTASHDPLLTLFTVPKAFTGHSGLIQRNAIGSWKQLQTDVDVILCGDDVGVAEAAEEMGVRHIPHVERNDYGTPILSSVFSAARAASPSPLLGYVNADIILFRDFVAAAAQLPENHLMIGGRWDIELSRQLDFRGSWESELRRTIETTGVRAPPLWIDYFVFSRKGLLADLPPFAVGRPFWDNWMIYRARSLGIPVVDATRSVDAVHQNHDYKHVPLGSGSRWDGPEAEANAALAGDIPYMSLHHATHVLTSKGLTRARTIPYLRARWYTRRELDGTFEKFARAISPAVVPVVRIRRGLLKAKRALL
jgi:hypothetical protein